MPLTFANIGEENVIRKISGSSEVRQHLADMGFVCGGTVRIISARGGDLIVSVKDTRVAVSRELASRIIIQ